MRSTVLSLSVLLFTGVAQAADTYTVDAAHSTALFRVIHLGASAGYGRFNDIGGTLRVDEANPSASAVDVVIQTTSVDTANPKRDAHLRSPDFLAVKQFPVMRFVGRSFALRGPGVLSVTGDLTLHGVTRSLTMDVTKVGEADDPWGGHRVGYETHFTVKRSDFGMTYMIPGVSDAIDITFSVEGIRQ